MDELQKKVLSRLQAQCARREYCISDIRKKAQKALETDDPARIGPVLESLTKDGFLDEARYASAYARDKASLSGWGPLKIRAGLRSKGIPSALADAAILEIDSGRADEKLCRLLEARMRSLRTDPQCRLKLIRYALSRGYEYDDVRSEMEKLFSGMMDQD